MKPSEYLLEKGIKLNKYSSYIKVNKERLKELDKKFIEILDVEKLMILTLDEYFITSVINKIMRTFNLKLKERNK